MEKPNFEVELARLDLVCEFDSDWRALTDAGGSDPAQLEVQLSSTERAANQVGESFGIGRLDLLCSWGGGVGMALRRTEERWSMASRSRVSAWADLNEDWPDWVPETPGLPILPRKSEILHTLSSLGHLRWYGLRDHETNTWEQSRSAEATSLNLQKAMMSALQLDMLVKSSGLPRGRMAAVFSKGIFWLWVSRKDDFLVLVSDRELSARAIGQIQMLGEGFLLL